MEKIKLVYFGHGLAGYYGIQRLMRGDLKDRIDSIAYGIAFATVLTLIMLPIFLAFSNKVKVNNKWLFSGNKVPKEQVERAIKEQHEEDNLNNQMVTKLVEESVNVLPTSEEVEDAIKELQEKDK